MTETPLQTSVRRPLGVGFAVVLLVSLFLPWMSRVRVLDMQLGDLQFRILRPLVEQEPVSEIALIGIEEETYEVLREPMALWHAHLGDLLTAVARARPLAVGFDISLPERSYDFVTPGVDRAFLRGIVAMRTVAPVVFGLTVDSSGEPRPVYPPFLSAAGQDSTGYVLWPRDPDRVVRRFTERLAEDGTAVPTLVGSMARHLGVEPGEGLIDYAHGLPFPYTPLQEVLAWHDSGHVQSLREAFAGKAVLVGSVLPFTDRHYQPVDLAGWEENNRIVPGILIHAQALRSILDDRLVTPIPLPAVFIVTMAAAGLWWVGRRALVALCAVLALLGGGLGLGTWLLASGYHVPLVPVFLAGILGAGGRAVLEIAAHVMERQRLRSAFAGYVSPAVLREILAGRLAPGLGGMRCEVCVLFSDIRGFTSLTESLDPEETIALLNRYFEEWAEAIQGHGGTLDKFIGDGVMAFFGAPQPLDNPCLGAFAATREMMGRLQRLNEQLEAEGRPRLAMGVGLSRGEAVVGHVGSVQRHEYTAIGDTVNLASRLEGLTKETGFPVLVTSAVAEAVGAEAGFHDLGAQEVRGHRPVAVSGWRPDTGE